MHSRLHRLVLSILTLIAGVLLLSHSTTANAANRAVTTTPTALRGTWISSSTGKTANFLIISKYSFLAVHGKSNGQLDRQHAIFLSGREYLADGKTPQLYVAKHRTKAGYWKIGAAHTQAIWQLKRVKKVNGIRTIHMLNTDGHHVTPFSSYADLASIIR